MQLHDLVLVVLAFVSELLGTLSGFGSSTFFVPSAVFFESFKFVLALTAILHCFGNFFRIFLFRDHFDKKMFLLLVVPSVVFTGVGAVLVAYFPPENLEVFLGIVLMGVAALFMFVKTAPRRIPKWLAISLSGVSGFATGFVGTGGAIRGIALAALQIEKNSFVMISSAVDIGGDFLRAGIYLANGYMDWRQWFYIPLLLLAAFAGAKAGQRLLSRIQQAQFETIVSIFVFLSGLAMVLRKVWD